MTTRCSVANRSSEIRREAEVSLKVANRCHFGKAATLEPVERRPHIYATPSTRRIRSAVFLAQLLITLAR